MLLYRITQRNFADLNGNGSRLYGGRWNGEGVAAVYLASSRSLAMLEALVHLDINNIPDYLCIMQVEVPDDVAELDDAVLAETWERYDDQYALKQIGNKFLIKKEKLLLKVPSAVVKQEFNFLFNPLHPKAAQAKIIGIENFTFDSRLI